jgi:hypothetical protein
MTAQLELEIPTHKAPSQLDDPATDATDAQGGCPVCGAMIEVGKIGGKSGWKCLAGGYAHYYQARYGYLERWFTSGEGNLREPVIRAMNCAA